MKFKKQVIAAMAVCLLFPVSVSAQSWEKVITFSGNGNKQTETFHISSKEWRISWQIKKAIVIGIYRSDGKIVNTASSSSAGEDHSVVRGSGDFYLDIASVGNYKIIVEQKMK